MVKAGTLPASWVFWEMLRWVRVRRHPWRVQTVRVIGPVFASPSACAGRGFDELGPFQLDRRHSQP